MGENVKHFTLEKKEDNTYGWPANEIVKVFLQEGYQDGQKEFELHVRDKKYKVLKRETVTVFYDEDGNTLFDVENSRLAKEYEVMNDASMGKEPLEETEQVQEDKKPLEQRAKEKLEKELSEAKDKTFADPVIKYLMKRCEEDTGMAEDVLQTHKTWGNCMEYIYEKARKKANGKCAAVRDDVVYEWAEDYFHQDDKALEEKRKKEEEERKKKATAKKGKTQAKENKSAAPKKESSRKREKEASNSSPKKKEPEGQMSLFDLL